MGDVEYGIATQCICYDTVIGNNAGSITNIIYKVNSKLGGTNFTLNGINMFVYTFLLINLMLLVTLAHRLKVHWFYLKMIN